jgi:hypothetical protein
MTLIEASVAAPDGIDGDASTTLSAPGGWGTLLKLEIKNSSGDIAAAATPKPAFATQGTITIDSKAYGELQWTLDKSATSALAPGTYTITAVLDFPGTGPGWHGKEVSAPATLTVIPASSRLDPGEARRSLIFEVLAQHATGKDDIALAAIDAFLVGDPNDVRILELKGDVLALTGKYKEAAGAYDVALDHHSDLDKKPTMEPPEDILHKLDLAIERSKK